MVHQANGSTNRLTCLLDWFAEHQITYDPTAIGIRADSELYSGEALGVFANRDVEEDSVLLTIPKASVLSVRNTSLAGFLEEHRLGGGLGLVFSIMHELALGPMSPWHGYLRSLPKREYIPLFWTPEELEMLQGTDAATKAVADREDTAADYEAELVPLLSNGSSPVDAMQMTLERFQIAASWIGSRAFGVDDYHGMALVPFADVFNHKAAIVSLSGDYALEGACLAEDGFEGNSSKEEPSEEGSDEEPSEEGVELTEGYHPANSQQVAEGPQASDDAQECPQLVPLEEEERAAEADSEEDAEPHAKRPAISAVTRGSMLDAALFPEQDLRLNIGICGSTCDGEEVLEIIAACPLVAGQEVFNTFGELGNAELCCKYGFCLRDNPFSTVRLAKPSLLGQLSSKAERKKRCQYLEEQSELLEEEEEPWEVLPRGQIGPSLLVAARILGCSPQEFAEIQGMPLTEALKILLPSASPSQPEPDAAPTADLTSAAPPSKRQRTQSESTAAEEAAPAHIEAVHNGAGLPEHADQEQRIDGQSSEEGIDDEITLGNLRIIDADPRWLPKGVRSLLTGCMRERLRQYRKPALEDDEKELQDAEAVRPRGESVSARIAALLLTIGEKTSLLQAVAALENLS